LEAALQELNNVKASTPKGPRVMLIGSTLAQGDFKVVNLLEETGAAIVFEDFSEGMRPYSQMIDINGDLMQALAESYFMKRLPAAYARPSTRERFDYFLAKAAEFMVDGIVWYSLLYRDIYDMEGFLFEKSAKEAGFPLLKITSDYDYGEKEPMRTRIETFTEMIKKR
jgi:benzoyl-CoA reductase/2-hydroxyglutaryl-CoA dehydratase subunit BcrC/BadD/HgdB